MSYHSLRTPREAITEIVRHTPPEVRPAIIALIRAAYRSLKRGYQPDVRAVPLRSWRSLLQLLSSVAAMQSETETLLRVSNDLLSMADHMAPPGEVLRQSAEILVHALHADLYVCRLRNPQGEWVVQAAARRDGGGIPMVVPALEEGIRNHPVMRTVKEGSARHVVSNNLRGIERGGESFDCVVYKAGYRSRLAFVLRERNDRPPFGLVLLYTQREYGFEMYDAHFLSKCARIVSLTTGRRLAVARDTLEKAGYFAGVYASTYWFTHKLDHARLAGKYTIWLADYRAGYNKTLKRDMHQYTSNGHVAGISGHVDRNTCTRDFPGIIKSAGLNGYTKNASAETAQEPSHTRLQVIKIGPVTDGDAAKIKALCDSLDITNMGLYSAEYVE